MIDIGNMGVKSSAGIDKTLKELEIIECDATSAGNQPDFKEDATLQFIGLDGKNYMVTSRLQT